MKELGTLPIIHFMEHYGLTEKKQMFFEYPAHEFHLRFVITTKWTKIFGKTLLKATDNTDMKS